MNCILCPEYKDHKISYHNVLFYFTKYIRTYLKNKTKKGTIMGLNKCCIDPPRIKSSKFLVLTNLLRIIFYFTYCHRQTVKPVTWLYEGCTNENWAGLGGTHQQRFFVTYSEIKFMFYFM